MLGHRRISPFRVGLRWSMTTAFAPARPRGSLLVLCSKVPQNGNPSLHPRVRRMLAGDPELARMAEENPRLLQKLKRQTEGQAWSGGRQTAQGTGVPLAALYVSFVSQTRSYREVAALLRSAISQGAADVKTASAVFDRLRVLKADSRRGSREDMQAAFQLALQETLRRLPRVDPRCLAALARAAYQLEATVAEDQQQRIVATFVSLVRASQAPPTAKVGPPAPREGWVELKLRKPPSKRRPEASAANTEAGGSEDSSCDSVGMATSSSRSSGRSSSIEAREGASRTARNDGYPVNAELDHSLSSFVWATLSNTNWQLPDEQLSALMECVRLRTRLPPMHNTPILVGLVRYFNTRGPAALGAHIEEGGTADVVLDRVLSGLEELNHQHASDTLVSLGTLRLRFPPGSLAALFQHALMLLEEAASQPSSNGGDSRSRLTSISKLFFGLSWVYDMAPEECQVALELPAARSLAQEFALGVQMPRDYEIWAEMLAACCRMGFNPPVCSQLMPLLESLLRHLPAARTEFHFLRSLDTLVRLGQAYGPPEGGKAALQLQPYGNSLAGMARGCLKLFDAYLDTPPFEAWCAARRQTPSKLTQLLEAFASLK